MTPFKNKLPNDFNSPIALPQTSEQSLQWQEANRDWWESNPMRYDWREKICDPEFTQEFYQEIDRRFFSDAQAYMPWQKIPFDYLIDFDSLKDKSVLEIGVGNGSHAQLLAQYSGSFTGIDLTDYAIESTSARMRCFGLNAKLFSMDAESMEFADNSFDLIWSWGVIHLSANTGRILKEMHRVLKPEGQAIVMVYHRNFWNYYIMAGLFQGIIKGDLLKTKSLHKTMQRYTDGALARFYSISEWKELVHEYFTVESIEIFGGKAEVVPLPAGKVKKIVISLIPNALSRFLTNRCQMGSFIVSKHKKH